MDFKTGFKLALILAISASLAIGCSRSSGKRTTPPSLIKLQISPGTQTLAKGLQQDFSLIGIYSDGSKKELQSQADWTSSATAIFNSDASIAYRFHAISAGSATVTATVDKLSASSSITVSDATLSRLELSAENSMLAAGFDTKLTLTGVFSDNSKRDLTAQAQWSFSDSTIASVTTSSRLLAVAQGTTTLSAVTSLSTSINATLAFTVTPATLQSLQIRGDSQSLPAGTQIEYAVYGVFSDGVEQNLTNSVNLAISNTSIASILETTPALVKVKGLTKGDTTLTASLNGINANTPVSVSDALLTDITLNTNDFSLAAGFHYQIRATGIFSDGTKKPLTKEITWFTNNDAVANVGNSISDAGLVTAVSAGKVTISALYGLSTKRISLTVSAATLVSLEIFTPDLLIPNGISSQLIATAVYSDKSRLDVTKEVLWTSSDLTVMTITNTEDNSGIVTAKANGGIANISASLNGISTQTSVEASAATLQDIQVSPASISLAKGNQTQFSATGIYSDNSKQDLSKLVKWASADTGVAVFDNTTTGLLKTLKQGSINVSATYNGTSKSATVTISPAALKQLQVFSTKSSIAKGVKTSFTASGLFTDGSQQDLSSQVVWSVNDNTVAFISNDSADAGTLVAIDVGDIIVTATQSGKSATQTIKVTPALLVEITLSPDAASIAKGNEIQFSATGRFTDNSKQDMTQFVTWNTDNSNVAGLINNIPGKVKALTQGTANIGFSYGTLTGSTAMTITAATLDQILVSADSNQIPQGLQTQLGATGVYSDGSKRDLTHAVVWSVDNALLASVDNTSGTLTAINQGNIVVTASLGTTPPASIGLIITAAQLQNISLSSTSTQIPSGTHTQITATGEYSDKTTSNISALANWSNSQSAIASLSSKSTYLDVTGIATGSTDIVVNYQGKSAGITITVTDARLERIEISPTSASVPAGLTVALKASGIYSDNSVKDITQEVLWLSTNTSVALPGNSTNDSGVVTALATGQAAISAQFDTILSLSATISVTSAVLNSISISPAIATVNINESITLKATGVYSDNSKRDISNEVLWAVSDAALARVTNTQTTAGILTGLASGSVTATANVGTKTASSQVYVSSSTLVAVQVEATQNSVATGSSIVLRATALYKNGLRKDVTALAKWSVVQENIASITQSGTPQVRLNGKVAGKTLVAATYNGVPGWQEFTVKDATINSISITPANAVVLAGTRTKLRAIAALSDGGTQDISHLVDWEVLSGSIAINNNQGSEGEILAGATAGSATVKITYGATPQTAQNNVTIVADASILSVEILPAISSIALGKNQKFTATAHFTGTTTTQDVSDAIEWTGNDNAVAIIDNGLQGKGTLYTVGAGSITLTADLHGVMQTLALNVVDAPTAPASIALSLAPNLIINNGSDSTTLNIDISAANPAATADNVTVDLQIISGTASIASSTTTTAGTASVTVTSTYDGMIIIRATVSGTDITSDTYLMSTSDLRKTISKSVFATPLMEGNVLKAGSLFGISINNVSTRTINIITFQAENAGSVLDSTTDSALLSGNVLDPGEATAIGFVTDADITDPAISIGYLLQDDTTQENFQATVTFNLTPGI